MRKFIVIAKACMATLLFATAGACAQRQVSNSATYPTSVTIAYDEVSSVFNDAAATNPCPDTALLTRLKSDQSFVLAAQEAKRKGMLPSGTYTVVVAFIIDKQGTVSDVKALTNLGSGLEEAAIRLLRKAPRWQPATQNDRSEKCPNKVNFQFIIP